jgi:hypothetical protein
VSADSVLKSQRDRPAPDVAIEVIKTHLVNDEGLLTVPIDPLALAGKLGISVALASLDPGVGGLISKKQGDAQPSIFLNRDDHENRRKFTCAHELGHYYRNGNQEAFGYVDRRDDLSATGMDPDERWANAFAAELIMPAYVVRKWFSEGWSLSRLTREFAVSEQAMKIRLSTLRLA